MHITRKYPKNKSIAASCTTKSRKVTAAEDVVDDIDDIDDMGDKGEISIAPEATDLLFEAEDVAELLAEVTGSPVDVSADGSVVSFDIGDETYTVEAEGDEEIVESSTCIMSSKRIVAPSKTIKRGSIAAGRTVKQLPKSRYVVNRT